MVLESETYFPSLTCCLLLDRKSVIHLQVESGTLSWESLSCSRAGMMVLKAELGLKGTIPFPCHSERGESSPSHRLCVRVCVCVCVCLCVCVCVCVCVSVASPQDSESTLMMCVCVCVRVRCV